MGRGGRRAPGGGGSAAACLFMGPGSFTGFTLQPVLKSKKVSKEGVEASLPEPREQRRYLFFGPWLSTAWSSQVDSGAGQEGLALCQGWGGRSGPRGQPLFRGLPVDWEGSELGGVLASQGTKPVIRALAKSPLASPL